MLTHRLLAVRHVIYESASCQAVICFCFSGFLINPGQTSPFAQGGLHAHDAFFLLAAFLVLPLLFSSVRWFLPSGSLVAVGFVKSHIFAFKEA